MHQSPCPHCGDREADRIETTTHGDVGKKFICGACGREMSVMVTAPESGWATYFSAAGFGPLEDHDALEEERRARERERQRQRRAQRERLQREGMVQGSTAHEWHAISDHFVCLKCGSLSPYRRQDVCVTPIRPSIRVPREIQDVPFVTETKRKIILPDDDA